MARARGNDAVESLPMTCTEALRGDEVKRLSERLVRLEAEDPLSSGILDVDDLVTVGCHHRIGRGGKDGIGYQPRQVHGASDSIPPKS